jgi:hypothetical protein
MSSGFSTWYPLPPRASTIFMVVNLPDVGTGINGVAQPNLLAVADHTPPQVITYYYNNGESLPDGSFEFHEVEPQGAVSRKE